MPARPERLALAALLLGAGVVPAAAQIPRGISRAASGPSPEVRSLLSRIDSTRSRFDIATSLLSSSSLVMEGVVASSERKAEISRELASANEREQRGEQNRVELNAEDRTTQLEAATEQRKYEHQRLSEEQSANVSNAAFNAALAGLMDARALNDARQLITEATNAAQHLNDPANAMYASRLQAAATQQLPAIVNAVPTQARLGQAIVGAARQAGSANAAVHVTEATATTDQPRRIDPNAI